MIIEWMQFSLLRHICKNPKSFMLRLLNAYFSKEYSKNIDKAIFDVLYA